MDLNLALIDVAVAWVVVALPRMLQARVLTRWDAFGPGQENRLRLDPVQHTSIVGTIAVPALTSLLGIPVLAWGKGFDAVPVQRAPYRALALVGITTFGYVLQTLLFVFLMTLLANVYLAGAPVAARAGQLCLRLAVLSLVAIPVMDAGIAWRFLVPLLPGRSWIAWLLSAIILAALWFSGVLSLLNEQLQLVFFYLTQLF